MIFRVGQFDFYGIGKWAWYNPDELLFLIFLLNSMSETITTNVDFNQPMISALSNISKIENVLLSVGKKEVAISKKVKGGGKKSAVPGKMDKRSDCLWS